MTMQGSYTSDGTDKLLEVPIDANWFRLRNKTNTETPVDTSCVTATWQEGDTFGYGDKREATIDAVVPEILAAGTGITKFNSTEAPLGTVDDTVTAISNDAIPRLTLTATAAFSTGDVIRLKSILGAVQLDTMEFTVTIIDGTHMSLPFMSQVVAGTTGGFYPVKYQDIFAPRDRFISTVSQAAQAVIKLTVTHEFKVGDTVRIMIPDRFGMKEANQREVKITAVTTTAVINTITVDLDTTGFTAFAYPLTAAVTASALVSWPQIIPVSGPLSNVAVRGFEIKGGVTAAGGVANDVIEWIAGDSFNV